MQRDFSLEVALPVNVVCQGAGVIERLVQAFCNMASGKFFELIVETLFHAFVTKDLFIVQEDL